MEKIEIRERIENKHISAGLTAFIVIASSIALFFMFERFDKVAMAVDSILGVLSPFIYGLVVAYLLCPIYNFVYRKTLEAKIFSKMKPGKRSGLGRVLASLVSLVVLTTVIVSLLWMILPGLIESIMGIIKMLPEKTTQFSHFVGATFDNISAMGGPLANITGGLEANVQKIFDENLMPKVESVFTEVSTGLLDVVSGVWNFIIGIFVCMFFLNSKDTFILQAKKAVYAFVSTKKANQILYGTRFVNTTFGKFISGKCLDSLIIGLLCFTFMYFMQWPYTMLVSVIVGVTNIIPFFGPFIGAVPSLLIIFMVDPKIALYFAIFILALQQLDGNVIGPKILGGSTGLPSFWVLFAILVGGGLFGFIGMIVGVPFFACIYAFTKYVVNKKLEGKGMTTNLTAYEEDMKEI